MSKFVVHKVLPYIVGMLFACVVILYPAYLSGVFDPIPYQDVKLRQVSNIDGHVLVEVDFHKNECEFKKLVVNGIGFNGVTPPLPWVDATTGDERGQGDRLLGRQTLRILIDTEGRELDEIEVRTRHDCSGFIADKVMVKFSAP